MKLCLFVCLCVLINMGDGYSTQSIRYRTKPRNDITIKIVMHLDKALTKRLSKEYGTKSRSKLKTITHKILDNTRSLFFHPSLNQTIRFKLIDIRFLRNNKMVTMDEDASKYLRNYCNWQAKQKMVKKEMFFSILLTGLDLFYYKNGARNKMATGRGYGNGMCSLTKSCAVLEWEKKNIGYLLAHEIGHSLGISHDGPPFNNCKGQGNIMTSRYDPKHHPKSWSACSKQYLKNYLRSKKSWCVKSGTRITTLQIL